jgi:integrase
MATRLTEDFVRKFKRPTTGQHIEFDELVSGFGVRFTPTVTCFVVQWRTKDKKKPREAIGGSRRWPKIGVNEARDLARQRLGEVLGAASHGAGVPLRLSMRTWCQRQMQLGVWRPRYASKVDSIVRAYIENEQTERIKLTRVAITAIDNLGNKGVGQVSRADVMAVVNAIKPGTAEQFMAIGSSYYSAMLEQGVDIANPFRNRLRVTGGRNVRHRTPTDKEWVALWHGFEKEGDPAFAAFQMLILTGARRREVTGMLWSELDLDNATWTLPADRRKTGKKDPEPFVIKLHPMAVSVIKRQPILESNAHVFWGRRDKRPFDFLHSTMDRLRENVKVENWRLHDVRRVMRSGMARLGITQAVAEQCLGHKIGGLPGVYDTHSYADEMAAAWQRWGDHVCTLTGAATMRSRH